MDKGLLEIGFEYFKRVDHMPEEQWERISLRAKEELLTKIKVVRDIFHDLGYHKYDDGEWREKIWQILEHEGHHVVEADRALDEIIALISKPPAPVLSDEETTYHVYDGISGDSVDVKAESPRVAAIKFLEQDIGIKLSLSEWVWELNVCQAQRDSDHKYYGGEK